MIDEAGEVGHGFAALVDGRVEVGIVGGRIGGVDFRGPDFGQGGTERVGGVEGLVDPRDVFGVRAGDDEGFGGW